jgi:hypothetical protein
MRPHQWLHVQPAPPRRWRYFVLFVAPWLLLGILDLFGI